MMRRHWARVVVLACMLAVGGVGCSGQRGCGLYQLSILNGLMQGDYAGKATLAQLRQHGDFGIGTFDHLDGEAIAFEGVFYQVRADGSVVRLTDGVMTSPFMMLTSFSADECFPISGAQGYALVQQQVDSRLKTKNIPYAIKIDGNFSFVKTRSVPAQSRPYPKLAEVARNQSVFEFKDVEGTLIGFRLPDYMEGMNMPGYHMHFLSRDRTKGGHLLECTIECATVAIAPLEGCALDLPPSDDFNRLDLSIERKEIAHVEGKSE